MGGAGGGWSFDASQVTHTRLHDPILEKVGTASTLKGSTRNRFLYAPLLGCSRGGPKGREGVRAQRGGALWGWDGTRQGFSLRLFRQAPSCATLDQRHALAWTRDVWEEGNGWMGCFPLP
jgi:hypothetical protein